MNALPPLNPLLPLPGVAPRPVPPKTPAKPPRAELMSRVAAFVEAGATVAAAARRARVMPHVVEKWRKRGRAALEWVKRGHRPSLKALEYGAFAELLDAAERVGSEVSAVSSASPLNAPPPARAREAAPPACLVGGPTPTQLRRYKAQLNRDLGASPETDRVSGVSGGTRESAPAHARASNEDIDHAAIFRAAVQRARERLHAERASPTEGST